MGNHQCCQKQKEKERKQMERKQMEKKQIEKKVIYQQPKAQSIERAIPKIQTQQFESKKQNEAGTNQIQDKHQNGPKDKTLQQFNSKIKIEQNNPEMKDYRVPQAQSNLQKCEQWSNLSISCQKQYQYKNRQQQPNQAQLINPEIPQQFKENNQEDADERDNQPNGQTLKQEQQIKKQQQNFKWTLIKDGLIKGLVIGKKIYMAYKQSNPQLKNQYKKEFKQQLLIWLASLPLNYAEKQLSIMKIKDKTLADKIDFSMVFGLPTIGKIINKLIRQQGKLNSEDFKQIGINLAKTLVQFLCEMALAYMININYNLICLGTQIFVDILFDVLQSEYQGTLWQKVLKSIQKNKFKWIQSFISCFSRSLGIFLNQLIRDKKDLIIDWLKRKLNLAGNQQKTMLVRLTEKYQIGYDCPGEMDD